MRKASPKMGCKFKNCIKGMMWHGFFVICEWPKMSKFSEPMKSRTSLHAKGCQRFPEHTPTKVWASLLVSCPISHSIYSSHLSILAASCKAPFRWYAMVTGHDGRDSSIQVSPAASESSKCWGHQQSGLSSPLCVSCSTCFAEPRDHRHHSSSWTRAYSFSKALLKKKKKKPDTERRK